MALYQGRALSSGSRPRRPAGLLSRILRVSVLLLAILALAHVPWGALRARAAIVSDVRVTGTRYLDPARVIEIAAIRQGDDLFRIDRARARQALLLQPRIHEATVSRRPLRGVQIAVVEREPVLVVPRGVPWEIDSAGVLLDPLQRGVTADVPLLIGSELDDRLRPGTHVRSPEVVRGLAWARSLARRELQLSGQVSEIDVSDPLRTALTLLSGTRVVAPPWPPSLERLSALRVVLNDLERKGTPAEEVDVRFDRQVIVRPAVLPAAGPGTDRG
jgi:cell division protein FtsQ